MTDDVKCLIRQMPLTTLDMNGTYQTELGFYLAASTGGREGTQGQGDSRCFVIWLRGDRYPCLSPIPESLPSLTPQGGIGEEMRDGGGGGGV